MRKKIGILFGGKSAEHEVSLQSAKNIFDAINRDKYEPILIGISKEGKWYLGKDENFILNADNPKETRLNTTGGEVVAVPSGQGDIVGVSEKIKENIDAVFPILHGPFGEDGTVQGLLKSAGIPFVGAGILGSAIGMDKDVMKRLLMQAGIKIGKYICAKEKMDLSFERIKNELGLPLFVKPANLGSSVGVAKVRDEKEFYEAVQSAFRYDTKIIIEENIVGREIECAVLGNDNPIASISGEIKVNHDFYSYEAKYIDEAGADLIIPADLPEEKREEVKDLAIKTFTTLCCEGLGRVDMFLREDGEFIVNEINTIPGFTKNSMYPKLWEASGIGYADLIDRLIELAVERFEMEEVLKTGLV